MGLGFRIWRDIALTLSIGAVVALLGNEGANRAASNLLFNWFSFETPYAVASSQKQELETLRENYEFQAESWEYAELAVAQHITDVTVSIEAVIANKVETIPQQILPFSGATAVISSSLFEVDQLCNISTDLNKLSSAFAADFDFSPVNKECANWKHTIASAKLEAFELDREIDDFTNRINSASEEAIGEAIDFLCSAFEVFCPALQVEQKLY